MRAAATEHRVLDPAASGISSARLPPRSPRELPPWGPRGQLCSPFRELRRRLSSGPGLPPGGLQGGRGREEGQRRAQAGLGGLPLLRPWGGRGGGRGAGAGMDRDGFPSFSDSAARAAQLMSRRRKRRSMMEIATTWTPAAYDRTAAHWQLTPSEVGDGSKAPSLPLTPPAPWPEPRVSASM